MMILIKQERTSIVTKFEVEDSTGAVEVKFASTTATTSSWLSAAPPVGTPFS
jgi:hypothetical protein